MQFRPVNFPVEDGHLLTQREILCRERCSVYDQAPDEQEESGDQDHKCEANHRKKDEPDDRAKWLMISLTATISRPDEIFGTDKDDLGFIVTPHEEINFGHRQTSEEDSGSGQSTTIDTRHPFFATQPKIPSCGRGAHSLMMHCLFLLRIDDMISDRYRVALL